MLSLPWAFLSEVICIAALLAYSQYIAFRAGVFSLATAGFAEIGAYTAAHLVLVRAMPSAVAILGGVAAAAAIAGVLALPLSRLRGVFQGIATLAFLLLIQNIAYVWTSFTNGAVGINGIPRYAGLSVLVPVVAAVSLALWAMERSGIGRRQEAVRTDEVAAASIGVRPGVVYLGALVTSGALGGLGGALLAGNQYSITPNGFGFTLALAAISFVVIGGYATWMGALFGAALLTLLPEILRPLAGYRDAARGILILVVMVWLPRGVIGGLIARWRHRSISVDEPVPTALVTSASVHEHAP